MKTDRVFHLLKKTIEERKAFAKIIACVWMDAEFKGRMLSGPCASLKEMRVEFSEGVVFKVVEDTVD